MKKIFIDLGAYNGDTIKEFQNGKFGVDPEGFEIYAFEPNPKFRFQLLDLQTNNDNVHVDDRAAWIEDCEKEFALDPSKDSPLGSTLMRSKEVWNIGTITTVQCFDFPGWLRGHVSDEDYVVVKMDVEGAEFAILEKMIETEWIKLIDKLFVEFHANKVKEYTTTYTNELIARISPLTNFKEWH